MRVPPSLALTGLLLLAGLSHSLNLFPHTQPETPPGPVQADVRHASNESAPSGQCTHDDAACLSATVPDPSPHQPTDPPQAYLHISQVTASMLSDSEGSAASAALFGPPRAIAPSSPADLALHVHPRVLQSGAQWEQMVQRLADDRFFRVPGSWSNHIYGLTEKHGPRSKLINELAILESTRATDVYEARPYRNSTEHERYRKTLQPLADTIVLAAPNALDALLYCALWASVAEHRWKNGRTDFLTADATGVCVAAAAAWAKVLLAHRTFHCNPKCVRSRNPRDRVYIWEHRQMWGPHHDWYTGAIGLALSYDLLYHKFSEAQRKHIRSAIALIVMKRVAWGMGDESKPYMPSIKDQPHRAFSSWIGYNAHLYVINLAIENETKFDAYTEYVLGRENVPGFNADLNDKYAALLTQFMTHSFYPDGSSFEDAFSYSTALREGSIALVALERRQPGVLSSPRFRNVIHNAAQMTEPWRCGDFVGHASGSHSSYAHLGLFRYVYPQGALPAMLWTQRFGTDYKHDSACHVSWMHSMLQLVFLGSERDDGGTSSSPEQLPTEVKSVFPTSFYAPRRGLLIARSSLNENATYVHFDCRPDAFLASHDSTDRGTFTFAAGRKAWVVDLPRRSYLYSEAHSLLHIDGLAEGPKTPSCQPIKAQDKGDVIITAGNLTYAYNVQWTHKVHAHVPAKRRMATYTRDGKPTQSDAWFEQKELNDPWTLGWPADDDAKDLGLARGMELYNVSDVGFNGLWFLKRAYRRYAVDHMVRSVCVVRGNGSPNDEGYMVVADSVDAGPGMHKFESYVILHAAVSVDAGNSFCEGKTCIVVLRRDVNGAERVWVHAVGLTYGLSFRMERFGRERRPRLVFESNAERREELWLVVRYVGLGGAHALDVRKRRADATQVAQTDVVQVTNGVHKRYFTLDPRDHSLVQTSDPTDKTIWTRPPMAATALTLGRKRRLNEMAFDRTGTTHFEHTMHDMQTVLIMYAQSGSADDGQNTGGGARDEGIVDVLNMCFAETGVAVSINVYDCEDPESAGGSAYGERACALTQPLPSSRVHDLRCGHGVANRRVELQLSKGRRYYVVVSADAVAGHNVRLVMRHETRTAGKFAAPMVWRTAFAKVPMEPRALAFKTRVLLTARDMSSDVDAWYMAREVTSYDGMGQTTWRVEGRGDQDADTVDVIWTCDAETSASTDVRVLDCGAGHVQWMMRYRLRRCDELVMEVGEGRAGCSGFRSRVRVGLDVGRVYLVVMTATRRDGDDLSVSLVHSVSVV